MSDPVTEAVKADLDARQQRGIVKYGVTLADNPLSLRDWLDHAYNECLDQAQYLKRAMMELDKAKESRMEWLPIESAPKDSKARMVWCPGWRNIYIVGWHVPLDEKAKPDPEKGAWVHFGGGYSVLREKPTHWMPLPAPPEAAEKP